MTEDYENLINSLINDNYLKTPEIIEAFKAIDRADFVLNEYKSEAYVNAPLPIGFGQTISQPLTVAFMIELLQPKAGEKILEIGAGSGWQTAILAYITNKQGQSGKAGLSIEVRSPNIIAIEHIPELREMAEKNVAKYNFIKNEVVKVIAADGSRGYKKEAPYNKIIAGAAASGEVPADWCKQLKIGGRIVAPVENSIVVIDKTEKNKCDKKEYFGFSFVPLISHS